WRHARRLAGLLPVMRRPWCVAQTLGFLSRRQVEQAGDRTWMPVDGFMTVADPGEPRRHRAEGEVTGLARVDLVPGQRSRDAGVGPGPDRVRARHGPVLGVLVVVE